MIILDTNVVSEPLKPLPDRKAVEWIIANSGPQLFLTSTSLAELVAGAAMLPNGKRKRNLEGDLEALLTRLFADRILAFDSEAARAYGAICGEARVAGRKLPVLDAQIAAIARVKGYAVATRDVGPYRHAGLKVINPWEGA